VAIALATAARGDVFRVLEDPRDAAQARIDLIQQATHRIDAIYFLARNDRISMTALSLLRDARRRGVETVRLIVDANFQHIPKSVLAHLKDEGVEVRVYHPFTLRHPSWIFRRMHEKVVVVDGARYITGGRNLADAYFGLAKKNFIDRDVYVDGPSAEDADRHFLALWSSKDVADLDVEVSDAENERAEKILDEAAATLTRRHFIALDTGCDWSEGEKNVDTVRFLHDPVVDDGGPRVAVHLAEMIAGAKSSIVVESPYVVPSRPLLELLEKKRGEGVRVQIVTNSLHSMDGVLPWAGYIKYRHRLLRHGVDIREFKGPDTLHAKTLVIDVLTVLVGSYNLDQRSQNLNAEAMCVVKDETIARQTLALIDDHIANSWIVGKREHRVRVPRLWRVRAWAARLFLPLYEKQL
jgi:phosphatidylserine/phosphatidylglycerophosphate/cardiolipin synthase-like enzyme